VPPQWINRSLQRLADRYVHDEARNHAIKT
jgi:hypothetical protein